MLRLLVDDRRVLPVLLVGIAAHRVLQGGDRYRVPDVILAAHAHRVVAADVEHAAVDRRVGEGVAMPPYRLFGDLGQADALDAGGGAGKIFGDEIRLQADRVENLRAAIGLIGGDAHLRHHLEQSLVDRLDVTLDDFLVVELLRQLALHRDERFKGEIRIDRFGAVAGEAGEMMHLARLAGFHHQADRGAQAFADQVMMHRRAGEQRRDLDAVGAGAAVGQDDDVDAFAHRGLGLAAERVDGDRHAGGAGFGRPGGVERQRLEMRFGDLGDRADLLQIGVGENRLMHLQALGVRQALEVEQVRPRPDDRDQTHDQLLADRVDRRVGHLGEVLLEIGEQELRLLRQRRNRRVIAHRADRLFAGGRHRRHQDFEVFLGVAEGLLAIEQRQVRDRRRFGSRRQILEHDLRALQPFAIGVALGQRRLEFLVGNEPAFLEIDQEHLARLQPPLGDDVLLRNRQHTDFRCHDDAVVAGDDIARRPQPVAVERGADLPAVGEGDGRGAVPRLHQRRIVFVELAAFLVHQLIAGPRLRNHHHHCVGERIAAHGEKFERVVEAGGVGLAFVGDRPQLLDVGAELRRRDRGLARRHPVVVAAQRIDLAVMRDHAVRMRQRPGRECVGGKALMH